ncbi:unnamed protein product [Caenorhabditis bovis]|uniref:Ubiquitin-like domain-containing protein n=1 Tax=Caenorhabditis bovis TaxID=2654633 RepID=A0A8S1F120_9PELO|nr:unnamed protein product [Caenorhabditis bovis]
MDSVQVSTLFSVLRSFSNSQFAENTTDGAAIQNPDENGSIQICVKLSKGNYVEVKCNPDTSVEYLKYLIYTKTGIQAASQRLSNQHNLPLDDDDQLLSNYGIANDSLIHLGVRLLGGGFSAYKIDPSLFDPPFNFDFRKINDDGKKFLRAGRQYFRPCGSFRYALKVRGRYENDDWLGSNNGKGEWVNAYHGTTESNVLSIARSGFDVKKCRREVFGSGIYCSPDPKTALSYATPYEYEGKNYKLVFQVRVDPTQINLVAIQAYNAHDEYWTVPDGKYIRPFAICVYEV